MSNYYVINLKEVHVKKGSHTLIFKGYVRNSLCFFEYDGDIKDTNAGMTDEVKKDFAKQLSEDYGYGIFDENKVKKQLEQKFQYRMKI